MSAKSAGGIILPSVGRCVECANPQPCFAHTAIVLKTITGDEVKFDNLPILLGAIIARMDQIERQIKMTIGTQIQ